jgi:hypothetical protein
MDIPSLNRLGYGDALEVKPSASVLDSIVEAFPIIEAVRPSVYHWGVAVVAVLAKVLARRDARA